jgi:GNAT superfamily N-acetyltransferase
MADIEIKTVSRNKELKTFIKFPWQIYKNDSSWVPPLIMDRKKLLDRDHNPFFQHAEMDLFLAYRDGKLVGRNAAIINHNHNKFHNDKTGFFGFFESVDDEEVSTKLMDHAAAWLKERGYDKILGPCNPSTNDEVGCLIEGFDTPPYIKMCHNPPYYPNLMEKYGMKKAKDLYAWHLDVRETEIPEKLFRVSEAAINKFKVKIRNVRLKDLKNELTLIREVYNNAWSKNWGFVPFTEEEITHAADDLKQIAWEELLLLAEINGRPVGFSITLPNINEILIKIRNGKLFPFGLFKLLRGMKKIKNVRVVILGIIKEYQHIGFGAVFYLESLKRAKAMGLNGGEMSWILEDNVPMNKAIELVGSDLYKTYRLYEKAL